MKRLSIHDNYLLSYEVRHSEREILFRTEYNYPPQPRERTNVLLTGVIGYQFFDDALGNILYSISEIQLDHFLAQYGNDIKESYPRSGAPGTWASDFALIEKRLQELEAKTFVLSSSIGIYGWVVAHSLTYMPGEA